MIQPKIQEVVLPIREVLDSNIINYIEKRFTEVVPKDYIIRELKKDFEPTKLVTFTPEEFETFKREFGKELLEKAAENAKTKSIENYISKYDNYEYHDVVDKKSITSVLNDYLLNNKI